MREEDKNTMNVIMFYSIPLILFLNPNNRISIISLNFTLFHHPNKALVKVFLLKRSVNSMSFLIGIFKVWGYMVRMRWLGN